MLRPTRPVPRIGAGARVKHFGGDVERGSIVAVYEEGRRVQVRVQDGQLYDFSLNPANARFASAAGVHGLRLELME